MKYLAVATLALVAVASSACTGTQEPDTPGPSPTAEPTRAGDPPDVATPSPDRTSADDSTAPPATDGTGAATPGGSAAVADGAETSTSGVDSIEGAAQTDSSPAVQPTVQLPADQAPAQQPGPPPEVPEEFVAIAGEPARGVLVAGRIIDAAVSSNQIHVGVGAAPLVPPASLEYVDLEYQVVFETGEVLGTEEDAESFERPQVDRFIVERPGTYTIRGSLDNEPFEFDVRLEEPGPRLGRSVREGTWGALPDEIVGLDGIFDLAGEWAGTLRGRTPAWQSRMSLEFQSARLELIKQGSFRKPDGSRGRFETLQVQVTYRGQFDYRHVFGDRNGVCSVRTYSIPVAGDLTIGSVGRAFTFELEGATGYQYPEFWADVRLTPFFNLKQRYVGDVFVEGPDAFEEVEVIGGAMPVVVGFTHNDVNANANNYGAWPENPTGDCEYATPASPVAGPLVFDFTRDPGPIPTGPVAGHVVAAPASGTHVTAGIVELRLHGSPSDEPQFTTAIDRSGRFEFPEVPGSSRTGDGFKRAIYDLSVRDATGPGTLEIHGVTDVRFAPATVATVPWEEPEIFLQPLGPGLLVNSIGDRDDANGGGRRLRYRQFGFARRRGRARVHAACSDHRGQLQRAAFRDRVRHSL